MRAPSPRRWLIRGWAIPKRPWAGTCLAGRTGIALAATGNRVHESSVRPTSGLSYGGALRPPSAVGAACLAIAPTPAADTQRPVCLAAGVDGRVEDLCQQADVLFATFDPATAGG
jgi:hypothetical protein